MPSVVMTAWNLTASLASPRGCHNCPGAAISCPALLCCPSSARGDQQAHSGAGGVSSTAPQGPSPQSRCHQQPSGDRKPLGVCPKSPAPCPGSVPPHGQARERMWAGNVLELGSLSSSSVTVSFIPNASSTGGQEQIQLRGEFTLCCQEEAGDWVSWHLHPLRSVELPCHSLLELKAEPAPHDFQRFRSRQNSPLDTDVLNKLANRGHSAGCSFITDTKVMIFFDQMFCYR